MQSAIRFLADSNIWIALCVTAWIYQSYVFFERPLALHDYALIAFSACATYGVYHLHRMLTLFSYPAKVLSSRYIFFEQHKIFVLTSLSATLILLIGTFFFLKIESIFILLILGLISFFYSLPFYKKYRLRDFGLLKPFWIAFVWASLAVYVPFFELPFQLPEHHFQLWLSRFFFIAAITVPFDVRDVVFDQNKIKFSTWPMKIGIEKSCYLSQALLLFSLCWVIVFLIVKQFSPWFYAAVLFSYLLTAIMLFQVFSLKNRNNPYAYTFYLDGTIIILNIALLLFLK